MAEAPDPPELSSFAVLDLDRSARRGYPEAVYCPGKTPEQVACIAAALRERPDLVSVFTRASPAHAAAIRKVLPDAYHDVDASLLAWPAVFDSSGIMTFIVGPDGDVYQKDLGPDTSRSAARITTFDPDLTWSRVDVSND